MLCEFIPAGRRKVGGPRKNKERPLTLKILRDIE
jgi:hypothetical protein